MADIASDVRKIVAQQLGVPSERVTDDAKFTDDLGADSLDVVEFVMSVEEHWKVEISDEAAERMKTVGDVIAFLQEAVDKAA